MDGSCSSVCSVCSFPRIVNSIVQRSDVRAVHVRCGAVHGAVVYYIGYRSVSDRTLLHMFASPPPNLVRLVVCGLRVQSISDAEVTLRVDSWILVLLATMYMLCNVAVLCSINTVDVDH